VGSSRSSFSAFLSVGFDLDLTYVLDNIM